MDDIGYAEESGTGTTYGKFNPNYNRKKFYPLPDPLYPFGGTGHVPLVLVPYTKEEIAAREEEEATRNARVRNAVKEEEKRMEKNAIQLAEFRRKQQQEKNNAETAQMEKEARLANTRQIWRERSNAAAARKNPLYAVYGNSAYGKGGRRKSRRRSRKTRRTRK